MPPVARPPKADLVFDIELLAVKRMPTFPQADAAKQQSTASGLKWQVLAPSAGAKPRTNQGVTMGINVWTPEGKLLIWGDRDARIAGALGSGAIQGMRVAFMKEAAPLMNQGSVCRFEVPAALAFGEKPPPIPGLQPNMTTVWQLELRRINDVPAFAMTEPGNLKTTASGLGYEVLRPGTGRSPRASDRVEVHYTGWLTDGTLFDSSHGRGEPITFPLGRVIPGWTEGVQLMQEGAIYRFTIPANLAYGKRGAPPVIGPDATLVFVVELIGIE